MNSPSGLIITPDLMRRVGEIEVAYTQSRMRVLERIPSNPVGIEFLKLDGAVTALLARNLPSPGFNSVFGLHPRHERLIKPLIDWYRAHNATGRFVMEPRNYTQALGRAFTRLDYSPSGLHAIFVREVGLVEPATDDVDAETVTLGVLEDYLDVYVAGWGIPERDQEQFKANVRPWLHQPGWRLYLARVERKPAAEAILYLDNGGAYCADAATHPAWRRHGLQAALLRRRIHDAEALGADFICGGADYPSASYRKMERAGMRLLALRTIWTPQ